MSREPLSCDSGKSRKEVANNHLALGGQFERCWQNGNTKFLLRKMKGVILMAMLSIVLQSFLVLYYAFSGGAKIAGAKYWADIFKNLGLPQWFRVITGIVQLVGVVLLIIGYWYTWAVAWAGVWLGITMLMACLAHFRVKDPISKAWPAIFFAVLIIILTIINVNSLV
jgi:uncharacterized membrane protein YphA (DoxX/SURF4 family)